MKPTICNLIGPVPSSRRKTARRGHLLTFGLLAMSLAPSQGAEFTWTGTTNNSWTEGGNWAGRIAPAYDGTADLVLPSPTAANPSLQGTLDAVYDIRTLTVESSGYFLQGADPGTLQLESGMTVNAPTTNNFYCDPLIKLGGDNTWNIAANNYLRPRSIDFGDGHTLTKTGSGWIFMNWQVLGSGALNHQGGDIYLQSTTPAPFTSVTIGSNGSLVMDYSSSIVGSRLNATAPITMTCGSLQLAGKTAETVAQSVADVTVSSGLAQIAVNPNSGTSTELTLASVTRNPGGLLKMISFAGPLGGANKILITSNPTLVNGLLPYAQTGDADLATYDAVNGVTPAAYQSTTITGSTAVTDNVNGTASETLVASQTINGLTLTSNTGYGGGLNLGGNTLTVTGGLVILGKYNESIDGGTLDFGAAEGAVYCYSQGRLSPGGGLTITGSGGMILAGGGLFWGGTAAWTGTTTVVSGIYVLNNGANSFPDDYPLVIAGGGAVTLAGNVTKTETVGSLIGAGRINISGNTGIYTLVAGGDHTSSTFSGQMDGMFDFTKEGTGVFTISGTGNNTGNNTVSAGTLHVTGTFSGSTTTVMPSGILTGTGTVVGDTYVLGTYGSRVDSSGTPSAEKIEVAGSVILEAGAMLSLSDKAVSPVALPLDTALTILSCSGTLTGTFSGGMDEGTVVSVGPNHYVIHYLASSVTLTTVAAPATDSYATWATEMLIPGEPVTEDSDHDGLTNGMEYALGLVPTVPDGAPGSVEGNLLSFTKGTAAKANGDVTYVIEESIDLEFWTPVVTQLPPDPALAIEHTLPSGQTKVFARLKVIIQ